MSRSRGCRSPFVGCELSCVGRKRLDNCLGLVKVCSPLADCPTIDGCVALIVGCLGLLGAICLWF